MKRSEINELIREATSGFESTGWSLPPNPKWDVTDFGLGDWSTYGLVLVNLADEPEYCEKLMYARRGMITPAHAHRVKKEDIIARYGNLRITVWSDEHLRNDREVKVKRNGGVEMVMSGDQIELAPGERVTLFPSVYHAFEPLSEWCVIGEVSTANDDLHDNFFVDPRVGRYGVVEEDEAPLVPLVSDGPQASY